MYSLGIDIGTTKIAATLVDLTTGNKHPCGSAPTPTLTPSFDGEHIQDAHDIIHTVKRLIDENMSDEVCAIGLSGQMHGIVYMDEKGQAVSPLYTWQDMRGKVQAEALGIRAGYGHATHAYNDEHGLIPAAACGYATIADAACASLCRLSAPVLHASNAASMGCFSIDKNRFIAPLKEKYPYEIESGYRIAGEYRGVPVAVGIGDNQASFLGSGCRIGEMLINIGTGSQVSVLSDHCTVHPSIEARPGFDGYYLLVGAALCGGRAYAVLHDFFCDVVEMATGERPRSLYEAMAVYQTNAGDASLRFDNAFCGTRQNPAKRGSIQGISVDNFTPKQFCVGLLEGTINELADLAFAMDVPMRALVGAGNALRKNPLLQHLCEKRFGIPLYLPDHCEEAAVGAALFAAISANLFTDAHAAVALLRRSTKPN